MSVEPSGLIAIPFGNATSCVPISEDPSGLSSATTPGAKSPPRIRSKPGPLTKALPRPSTTISFNPYAQSSPRSAWVTSDASGSIRRSF